jgi:hypothetical protein
MLWAFPNALAVVILADGAATSLIRPSKRDHEFVIGAFRRNKLKD